MVPSELFPQFSLQSSWIVKLGEIVLLNYDCCCMKEPHLLYVSCKRKLIMTF